MGLSRHDKPLVKFLTGANQTIGVAFATEAGQFQAAGLSAIVCGPGSIDHPSQSRRQLRPSPGASGVRKFQGWASPWTIVSCRAAVRRSNAGRTSAAVVRAACVAWGR